MLDKCGATGAQIEMRSWRVCCPHLPERHAQSLPELMKGLQTDSMCTCVRMCACLHFLAVIEQNVAQLFGHHVQVSLLSFVGSSQHVELGEIRGEVVESPETK